MLSKTFYLLFYLKRPKNYNSGKMPVYLRVTANGKRFELAIKRECDPDRWNLETGRMIGSKEEAKRLNSFLDSLQSKVHEAQQVLLNSGKAITADSIRNVLLGIEDRPKMIMEIFKEHNQEMQALIGKDFTRSTYNRYEAAFRNVKEFLLFKYKVSDVSLDKLDYSLISAYSFYLKGKRNISHNTTMKYLVYFKKIVLLCVKSGWIVRDPFFAFSMAKQEVDRRPLDEIELAAIVEKKFPNERLRKVRDIFVFCCYTGLSYVDVQKLKRSEMIDGFDGRKWLSIKRQKTDTPSKIPLLPVPLKILERYSEHIQCISQDRLLPVMTNQRMNSYLKEIADVCGIERNITFHLARHTFATTVTLSNNVPIESVSKMLGHKDLRTTQHYAKIIDKKVSNDMEALRFKLESKGI
ncbi:site-specific integrase [Dyadobacter chenhuakuii]|uniref:Site-specific integrase n=1 Tax=Dyadobacter chenhuakuii TaxID=2909339 RepID=A0A9X1Q7W0_9BACT|nr:site-specific integrase [Dyadobacter chenhuakuii]MCF2496783.1 site-specific integrase [Dyadobacter chenhuakuii]